MNRSSVQNLNPMSHDTHHHDHHIDASKEKLTTMGHHHLDTTSHHSTMKMYFHTGIAETILFESWTITSITIFICSWIFIFILGILYEGLREIRQYLDETRLIERPIISKEENENELERMNTESIASTIRTRTKIRPQFPERILHSVLYAVHLILGYSLMLIAMTFNVYLFFAIIFGIGTGHFLYAWCRTIPLAKENQRSTR
ncbi:unnamed protein product [Rotaria magnacalcarata]|uniref:Copper transport protein n=1 Tax=Rotaria magnacalcarata TaxID=392030 RepID=A0A816ZYK1_9BILA|nr:unnamed protein product [Rotaria magnacalcarata]CAF1477369.1 unnamed protein product [Rotaria magnacalcarata]CAF2243635.1 unnamed protein product [Rotaria magnacalcarata]CAF3832089.1 unnamed protein product [Rotaria magnacalcarata]CAF3892211.1 unnamed protein product [Rotaria magnacalcarata]